MNNQQNKYSLYLIITLLLALCMSLFACGGSESVPDQNDINGESPEEEEDDDDELGIEEFGLTMEQLVPKVEQVESAVADCMRENGFEYVAVDFNTVQDAMIADKAIPGLTNLQFKEQYGWGISTLYFDLDAPQLAEPYYPARIGLGEQNVQIFNGLSATDQVAYNRTLLGENTSMTFAVAMEAEDFSETGGCTRTAVVQTFTLEELSETYINPVDALYLEDPRMISAIEQYTACIREKGYDYNDPDAIEPDIEQRLETILDGADVDALSPESQAELETLQAYERAVSVAAYECISQHVHPVEEQIDNE